MDRETTIYSRNIEALRQGYADVAAFMESAPENLCLIDEERDIRADAVDAFGKKILIAEKGGITYRLDSLYDSDRMLELWFNGLRREWDLNAKLFMYGLGNGMYVRRFLERARKDCLIVVHEPSYRVFKTVLENFDLTDIFADSRFIFVFWPLYINKGSSLTYLDIVSYGDIRTLAAHTYLNYADLFSGDFSGYVNMLREAGAVARANQKVNDFSGEYYSRNVFSNLRLLEDSYDLSGLSEQVPVDVPAIVVAAGPSLDKNIHELKRAMGKCLIVSTDTALRPLALAGITPDISAITDSRKDERYLSEEESRNVPMVCTPRSGTEFLHLHTGKKFFVNDFCEHIGGFMKSNGREMVRLSTGGSVANVCFSIARYLGCRRIILVGQDLAYTGDKTHSAVTVRGEKKTAVEDLENVEMDIDIYGDPIRSSNEFKLYKEWFEQQIGNDKDFDVIDATEGGVRIGGTRLMTLRDAIDEYCTTEFDFSSLTDRSEPLFDSELKDRFREFVKRIPDQLADIRRLIKDSITDYSSMRQMVLNNDYRNPEMKRLFQDCKVRTEMIESSPIIEYVHTQLKEKSTQLLDRVNRLENDERQELLTVCDLGEQHLKDMDQAAMELESYINMFRKDFDQKEEK